MRSTSERLPWLEDEPAIAGPDRAARPVSAPKVKGGRFLWPWYLLFALLIGLVGFGAWWLGTHQREAAPPELPAEEAVPIPVNRSPEPASNDAASAGDPALPAPPASTPIRCASWASRTGTRPPTRWASWRPIC